MYLVVYFEFSLGVQCMSCWIIACLRQYKAREENELTFELQHF